MKIFPERPRAVFLFLFFTIITSDASSHESRPNFIRIRETTTDQFIVNWKIPASVPEIYRPYPVMPGNCRARDAEVRVQTPDSFIGQQLFTCTHGLAGQSLALKFPVVNPSLTSLLLVEFLNRVTYSQILRPGETVWKLPDRESRFDVAREYMSLGIQHIYAGVDHLLFITCLVIIARKPRRILLTITGFTVAHSLTLVLSTLKLVQLPVPPVEALIALSIIFLAHEIAAYRQGSWTWRYPITVACCFGLLHGFGFAAVLRSIGLPQLEFPAALLFFNIGVETGQVLFVILLSLVFLLYNRISRQLLPGLNANFTVRTAAYIIGPVAAFWFVQRVAGFWH